MNIGGGMANMAAQAQLAQQDYLNAQAIYQQMAMQRQMYGGGMYPGMPGMGMPGMGMPGMGMPGMGMPGMQMPIDRNAQLIDGVKNGRINKEEFVSLGNFQNETARLKAQMAEGGLNQWEQMALMQRQVQYDRMYQAFNYGDYHPRTSAKDDVHQRQLNQMGRIFNGLESGSVTRREGDQLLDQQQGISYNRGRREADGHFGIFDRMAMNNQLDNSSYNIFNLKNNWSWDSGAKQQQWPPFFFPQPMMF